MSDRLQRSRFRLSWDAARDVLGDPGSSATAIHLVLLHAYGGDALYDGEDTERLDPSVLYNLIEEDFNVTFPVENENKVQALTMAIENDGFYSDPIIFSSVALALSRGDMGDLINGAMHVPIPAEAVWALFEVNLNRDDEPEPEDVLRGMIMQLLAEQPDDPEDRDTDSVFGDSILDFLDESRTDMEAELRRLEAGQEVLIELSREYDRVLGVLSAGAQSAL